MKSYKFIASVDDVGGIEDVGGIAPMSAMDVINEPMVFNAGWDFAWQNGGHITRSIMAELAYVNPEVTCPDPERFIAIDTRVHMLMPGMYPAIPGWHCDSMPRDGGQPNVFDSLGKVGVRHWVSCVSDMNADLVCPTLFVVEDFTASVDPERVWESVSEQVEEAGVRNQAAENGRIYSFGVNQLHRCVKCTKAGWRFFFRLSHQQAPVQNHIRNQVQVYTTDHGGW